MGLKINTTKTKIMVIDPDRQDWSNFTLHGHKVDEVGEFVYLRSTIISTGRVAQRRLGGAWP